MKTNGTKNFVVIDGSMAELIRPSLYDAYQVSNYIRLATLAVESAFGCMWWLKMMNILLFNIIFELLILIFIFLKEKIFLRVCWPFTSESFWWVFLWPYSMKHTSIPTFSCSTMSVFLNTFNEVLRKRDFLRCQIEICWCSNIAY